MSVGRKDIVLKVRQWIEHAKEDLRLSNHAMTMKTAVPYRLVAYHAQQCTEKCLKAVAARYPGEADRVSKREAVSAIAQAGRVLKTVAGDLKMKKFL